MGFPIDWLVSSSEKKKNGGLRVMDSYEYIVRFLKTKVTLMSPFSDKMNLRIKL